ncbi:hypothetical protein LCGC14_2463400, partial [marine sediment metagenome]
VADIVADYARLLELQEILELEQQYGSAESLAETRAAMVETVHPLQGYLSELDAVGVSLRDFGRGLVDFPARVAGADILFCWQLGEQSVLYWHRPDEGLSGRKPISELASVVEGAPTAPS